MRLDGTIFTCGSTFAFRCGASESRHIILIGGLGDRMLGLGYTGGLAKLCTDSGVTLVVPQLRSQPAYEQVTIDSDIEDIASVVDVCGGDVVLIGHSTGCQDALLYFDQHPARIRGIILQAPVSDVEAAGGTRAEHHGLVSRARSSGPLFLHGDRLWLAERFLSLFEPHGREDLFSSYLGDEAFRRWNRSVPILSVLSECDEYCPRVIDGRCYPERMVDKFALMGDVVTIGGAGHGLDGHEDAFVAEVEKFLRKIEFLGSG